MDKISFRKLIKQFFVDENISWDEGSERSIRRGFEKLLEFLGSDMELLKNGGRTIDFQDPEQKFMRVIIKQLFYNKGLVADFVNNRSGKPKFSPEDIYEFIEAVVEEEKKDGASADNTLTLSVFLQWVFLYSPLRIIDDCHKFIDGYYAHMQDLTKKEQVKYLTWTKNILRREMELRVAENAISIKKYAELIEWSKKDKGDDMGFSNYSELESELAHQYMQRDDVILLKIQEDDDLREYIEKKLGKKAEDIFNYAASLQ